MSKTRNNHYVPQWYQEGFFEIGRSSLAYLDTKPPQRILDGGRVITEQALFDGSMLKILVGDSGHRTSITTSFSKLINGRHPLRLCKADDPFPPRVEIRVRADNTSDIGGGHCPRTPLA